MIVGAMNIFKAYYNEYKCNSVFQKSKKLKQLGPYTFFMALVVVCISYTVYECNSYIFLFR